MTVLIDPPMWPAHDRLWSHLVSDTSLRELREVARAAEVPDQGFDLDHYDVPADRYADLVAAGAVPVDGGEVARRLGASGLRVSGHERAGAKRAALLRRWAGLWCDGAPADGTQTEGGTSSGPVDVGEDLVDRWREPHRVYHGRLHLKQVLDALDLLTSPSPHDVSGPRTGIPVPGPDSSRERWLAAVALWFHDAVHDGATPHDEEASAALARQLLAPLTRCQAVAPAHGRHSLTTDEVAEVARLVVVTAGHDPDPEDLAGCLVSDADLAILGSPPPAYRRYVHQVRAEYGHVTDADFRRGRAAVLDQLLALHAGPGLFRTPAGRERWAERAAANLRAELTTLR